MSATNDPIATTPARLAPEFIPLPSRGPDPLFGLCRSWYYDAERRGLMRLVRIRKPGTTRGRVLLPVAETSSLLRRLSSQESDK